MQKINRDIVKKLRENYFGQSIHFQDDDWDDVPDMKDDKEYTTQLPFVNPINPTGTDMAGPMAVKAGLMKELRNVERIKRSIEQEIGAKVKGRDILQDPPTSAINIKPKTKEKVLIHEPKPLKEQKPGEEAAAGTASVPPPQPQGQVPPGVPVDPNTGQPVDPGAVAGTPLAPAIDPMTGMPVQPPPPEKTPKEIGRTFELKKIYARLIAIDSHLSTSSDEVLLKLRKYVNKSLEMFDTLLSNVGTFKDQLDDIIVIFYRFLDSVYNILRRFYEGERDDDESQEKATMKDIAMVDLDRLTSDGEKAQNV